jgi:antitoxin CptB
MTSEDEATRRKRLLYRAMHRGTKEMDWLLGRFAAAQLETMTATELDRFEALVGLPDPDIQDWILTPAAAVDPDYASLVAELRRFHGLT